MNRLPSPSSLLCFNSSTIWLYVPSFFCSIISANKASGKFCVFQFLGSLQYFFNCLFFFNPNSQWPNCCVHKTYYTIALISSMQMLMQASCCDTAQQQKLQRQFASLIPPIREQLRQAGNSASHRILSRPFI